MSDYDDRPRRRSGRTREPEYVETQETYVHRGNGGGGNPNSDLVLRSRDDYDDRDYADYRRTSVREEYAPRRARSVGRRSRDHYDDEYYSDYGPSARGRRQQSRYDGNSADDSHSDRPRRERRKSKVGEVLDGLGLGGVAAAATKAIRSSSRPRRRRASDSERSRSRNGRRSSSYETRHRWQQAAKAAVITGVVEAVRSRKEPGGWTGQKGRRIATAALGAAGIDGFLEKDPDHKGKRHILESVVGGLAANRLANGPRDQDSSDPRGRSRSRSRSVVGRLRSRSASIFRGRSSSRGPGGGGGGATSTLKDVAAVGGVAAIGKAIYDRVRSKSRGRTRRDNSVSSDDSYVPSRHQRYQPDRGDPSDSTNNDDEGSRKRGRSEGGRDDGEKPRGDRSHSSSTISTTDLENQRKKTRGKELLTAGLATVATIHAAHGVYSSMTSSQKRHKLVMEGEMTKEKARKLKSKNLLQDAAAIGIAALGIKSAFSEWKEMNEQRREKHELEARHSKRRKARERREREMRMQAITGGGANQNDYSGSAQQYYDSNPYQSYGNLPPPPVGAPPPNRYQ